MMAKHLKNKNQPASSSDDDDDLTQAVAVPGTEGMDGTATGNSAGVQDVIAGAGPYSSSGAEEGWRRVVEQVDSLRAVLPSTIVASARLPVIADTWQSAAILGAAATEQREAAILSPPRGAATSGGGGGGGRSQCLPSINNSALAGTGARLLGASNRLSAPPGGQRRRHWRPCRRSLMMHP